MQEKEKASLWQQVKDFFPGIFEDEVWQAIGRGIARFCRYIYREPARLRAAFLLIAALIFLRIYTGRAVNVYELSSTPDCPRPTIAAHISQYDPTDPYAVWTERDLTLTRGSYGYGTVHRMLGELEFRRLATEPFARLKAADALRVKNLSNGDTVLYLQLLDDEGDPFLALQYLPDDRRQPVCYYSKDGIAISSGEFLKVKITAGSFAELAEYLYDLSAIPLYDS